MDIQKIKQAIEDFLKKMTVRVTDVKVANEASSPRFMIETPDAPLLIGRHGEHFTALSHVIKKVILKDAPEDFNFSIDINGYQESNLEMLKNKARVLAERVKSFKTEIEMDPMSSYERMTIHTMLENDPNIITESRGDGASRRLVIKYTDSKDASLLNDTNI